MIGHCMCCCGHMRLQIHVANVGLARDRKLDIDVSGRPGIDAIYEAFGEMLLQSHVQQGDVVARPQANALEDGAEASAMESVGVLVEPVRNTLGQ